jgi:hypothetical protein
MYGRRLYRRRSFTRHRRYGMSRYVTDIIAFDRELPNAATGKVCVIAPTSTAGVRKVRGFRLELTCAQPCMFALIYFPEGISTDNAQLNTTPAEMPTSLYTPERHIITSGILRDSALTIARSAAAVLLRMVIPLACLLVFSMIRTVFSCLLRSLLLLLLAD